MRTVNISTSTILRVFLIPLIGYVIWENKDILFAFFIAFIFLSALRPFVDFLHHKKKLKRPIAAILVYLGFILTLSILIGTIIPPIISETLIFIQHLPETLSSINPNLVKSVRIQEISQYVPNITNQIIAIATNVFSNTMFVVTALVFGFYMLANEHLFDELFGEYVSPETLARIERTLHSTESRLSSWFWGELTLMLAVGTLSYIGFFIIGLKYALPLAVLAGLLEAVPNIGPTIAAIPAVLIGFTQTPVVGVAALAWTFIVQQLENNLLVPYIMKRAVGVNPIVTMLAILVGLRLAGPIGVILAIPLYLCIEVIFLKNLRHKREDEEITR